MIFGNTHFVIALIVAPILAVLAWYAVGQLGAEEPQAAVAGQVYSLVEKSNCRYPSGHCRLENEDFKLVLSVDAQRFLVVHAEHALDSVLIALASSDQAPPPRSMQAVDGSDRLWQLDLGRLPRPDERIRLVASAGGSRYFAEASTLFVLRETNAH